MSSTLPRQASRLAPHLALSQVAKRFGDHTVFEDVSLDLSRGEHVALIGPNGGGKSSLLRLLAGLDAPDAGTVTRSGTVGLLAQHADLAGSTLLDAVTPPELRAASARLDAAAAALNDPSDAHLAAFSTAEEDFRLLGGHDFEVRARGVLAGLGLDPAWPRDGLSGGQARRAMLARLLLSPADFLLLDEPTNHLDADSLAWLEGWVRASPAGVLVVSHDRAFLDATVTRVCELERGELHVYPGAYSEAMEAKAVLRAAQERDHAAYTRKRRALEQEAARRQSMARSANAYNHKRAPDGDKLLAKGKAQKAQNLNAARARALEQRAERLAVVEKPFDDRTLVAVPLPDMDGGPNEVLRVRDLAVARGGRTLFSGLSFTLRRGERLALLGPNGSGKSSLLAAILGGLAPEAGEILPGHGLSVYRAGQHGEELAGFVTLADALLDAQPALRRPDLYPLLAGLGLPPDPDRPLAGLSGGQRTRLTLARLGVTRAHLLVLDEPTNHLDLRAIEALEDLLLAYPGTVLFASHDRRLVERVATDRLVLGG